MELDTGTSVSLVSEIFQLQEKGTILSHSQAKLCIYTGQAINVMRTADARVETATLPLFVTRGKGLSLLGRNWLETLQLDWISWYKTKPHFNKSLIVILMFFKMNWVP